MDNAGDAVFSAQNVAKYLDTLTVLELVTRLEDWAVTNVIGSRSQVYPERDMIIAALRKAVIRDASVGRVSIKHVVAVGNFVDDAHITFSKRPQDRHWLDYDLIPKETP